MDLFKVTWLRRLRTSTLDKQMSICLVVINTRNPRNLVTGKEIIK